MSVHMSTHEIYTHAHIHGCTHVCNACLYGCLYTSVHMSTQVFMRVCTFSSISDRTFRLWQKRFADPSGSPRVQTNFGISEIDIGVVTNQVVLGIWINGAPWLKNNSVQILRARKRKKTVYRPAASSAACRPTTTAAHVCA